MQTYFDKSYHNVFKNTQTKYLLKLTDKYNTTKTMFIVKSIVNNSNLFLPWYKFKTTLEIKFNNLNLTK